MKNTGPFTFIARNRLRPGALDAQRRRVPDLAAFVEESEPQLLAFNEYVDVTSGEVTVVQVHPDSRSMELHMEIVRERAASAYAETLEATTSVQVFGTPSDAVIQLLRTQAGAGVQIDTFPEHLGGFTRIGR
jgi:hypothetical protein